MLAAGMLKEIAQFILLQAKMNVLYCTQTGHLELRNENGYTAIMLAVAKGCCEAARVLLSLGVDCRAEIPQVRTGLLQIAAQTCRRDPETFFRSGMASLLLGLKMEQLHIPTIENLTEVGFSAIDARKEIEAAVQTVLDEGYEKNERAALRYSGGNTVLVEENEEATEQILMKEMDHNDANNNEEHSLLIEEEKIASDERIDLPLKGKNCDYTSDDQSFITKEQKAISAEETSEPAAVSGEVHQCILLRLKQEATETAEAWLKTKAGQNMMQKKVSIVKGKHPQLQFEERDLIEIVKNNFIKNHIQELVTAYKNLKVKN